MKNLKFRSWLAYGARRAGLPGAFGLAMLFLAVTLNYFFVLAPSNELLALDQLIRAKQGELLEQEAKRSTVGSRSGPDQLADFYRRFPLPDTIPALLAGMYRAADREGVALSVGDYSLLRGEGEHLQQYRITFPMKGSYPKIRRFISTVLVDAPALALESLQLKRENAGEGEVDARLVFILYYMVAPT
jgi:hypothetical protein